MAGRADTVNPLTVWSVSQCWKSCNVIAGACAGVGASSRIRWPKVQTPWLAEGACAPGIDAVSAAEPAVGIDMPPPDEPPPPLEEPRPPPDEPPMITPEEPPPPLPPLEEPAPASGVLTPNVRTGSSTTLTLGIISSRSGKTKQPVGAVRLSGRLPK